MLDPEEEHADDIPLKEDHIIADADDQDDELYEYHRFTADPGQSPLRIDKFLVDRIVRLSRNRIQNAAKAGNILVNKKPVKPNYKVRPGDDIRIVMPHPPSEYSIEPEDVGLDIVYEDDDLMVVNKQAGLVVHPGHGNFTGTLVHGLLHHQLNWPESNGAGRPGIVHRLDKNTSGLLVVGKTEYALSHLARQFFDRTTDRKYNAFVWGDFDEDEGTIEGNIGRDPKNRRLMKVFPEGDEGKHAVTHYKVLRRFGYATLIECKLETGRTHQIRVHMKHLRHPLFNDFNYGGDKIMAGTVYTKYKQFIDNCFKIMPFHSLHARSLGFDHPETGKRMHFEQPLPDYFKEMIEKWERYTNSFNI
ncbi:MAG: RluA family pseudouridine synthase [Bacteroidetes bacterium]|nr:RluA family pseudouridine synthase [Bacteroidota bacterium]